MAQPPPSTSQLKDDIDAEIDRVLNFVPPVIPAQETPIPDQGSDVEFQRPPDSPALSDASSAISVSQVKNRKGKLWKKIAPINIKDHGGEVVKDTGLVVFKVPSAAPRPFSNGAETNRFGEPLMSRAKVKSYRPLEELQGPALQDRVNRMLRLVRAEEEQGKDLSDTVVKLHVAYASRVPAEGTRVIREGTRLSTIPVLPPFEAFSTEHAVREGLKKPIGDPTRPFPLSVRVHYKELDPRRYFHDVVQPWISGLDHVREFLDNPSAQFTVRSIMTEPTMHMHLNVTAMTIHRFNCNAQELIDLSGAVSGPDTPLPSILKRFSMDEIKSNSFVDMWNQRLPDIKTNADRDLLAQMTGLLLGMDLPARNACLPNHKNTMWAPFSDEIIDRIMALIMCYNKPLAEVMTKVSSSQNDVVKQHFLAYYRGYLLWRYYYFPDQVLACCAMDYIALHPRMDTWSIFLVCPGGQRAERHRHASFSKRVTAADRVQDPSKCMLFMFFHDNFDAYGASMFLYKLVCARTERLLRSREEVREQKRRAQPKQQQAPIQPEEESDDESSNKPQDACHGTSRGSVRTRRIYVKRVVSILEALADIDPSYEGANTADTKLHKLTQTPNLARAMVQIVLQRMNDLYSWRRFPGLCSSYVGKRERIALANMSTHDADSDGEQRQSAPAAAAASSSSSKKARKEHAEKEKKELPKEGLVFDAMLIKSMRLGRVIVTLPRDRVPEHMKADLECALNLFNSSFKIVGEKQYKELGRHAHKDHPRNKAAAEIIHQYMKHKNLFANPRVIPEVRYFEAFLLGNRAECPELLLYSHRQAQVKFSFVPGTELHKWFMGVRSEYEEQQRKKKQAALERKAKRAERLAERLNKKRKASDSSSDSESSGQDLSEDESLLSLDDADNSDEELLLEDE